MRLIGLILFLAFSNLVYGQKFLQMEKYGSLKVKKYYLGDEITYQINGDKTWYTETIQDLIIEENIILLANRYLKISDIKTIKSFKSREWSKRTGIQLYGFAGAWILFSVGGALASDWELRWDTAIIAGTAIVTGFLIQKIFKSKKYKIGKKRKLRMLDITMIKPVFGP
ncbi:MAG: hypothetical protein ACI8P3_000067 [Saprospiraceae bacterium]|jgi:hypothetical protein